jgi:hypothetical protein
MTSKPKKKISIVTNRKVIVEEVKKKKLKIVVINKPILKDNKRRFFRKYIFLHPLTVVATILEYLEGEDISFFIQAVHELDEEIRVFKPTTAIVTSNIHSRRLSHLAQIPWLQHLTINSGPVRGGSACISSLGKMQSLLTLEINCIGLRRSWTGFSAINLLTRLGSLKLSNLDFTKHKEILFSEALTLHTLSLLNCKLSCNMVESINVITSLTSLDLSSSQPHYPLTHIANSDGTFTPQQKVLFSSLVHLKRLNLSYWYYPSCQLRSLPSTLEYLTLNECFTITFPNEITSLTNFTVLKELSLCGNFYPDIYTLSCIANMTQLHTVDLTNWRWDIIMSRYAEFEHIIAALYTFPTFITTNFTPPY